MSAMSFVMPMFLTASLNKARNNSSVISESAEQNCTPEAGSVLPQAAMSSVRFAVNSLAVIMMALVFLLRDAVATLCVLLRHPK